MKDKFFCEDIYGYGYDGEGICRHNGKVVFLPYALQGERVKFEVVEERSSFCRGKVVEVTRASEKRQQPPCPYFSICGGCTYQHTSHENELEIKRNLLAESLKKVGYQGQVGVEASPKEYGYRNKIRLFVSNGGLALRMRGSGEFCQIDRCLLVKDMMNDAIIKINNFLNAQQLYSNYREVIIRQENENLLVNFVLSGENRLGKVNYQGLYLILGANCGIFESFKGELYHKIGLKELECQEFGLKCKFSPLTFHQVNDEVGKKLYEKVIEKVKGKSVVNCYSGAGVLSGALVKAGKRVVGIELGDLEHTDAQKLKEDNNLFYLTNLHGDCGKLINKIEEGVDCIIVDPPRAGMDKKVADAIDCSTAKRLIYISCNSATFVRDLSRIRNFKLKEVCLFDMFSRTGEYEVLGVLDRN